MYLISDIDKRIPKSKRHPDETIREFLRYDSGYLKDLFFLDENVCFSPVCIAEICLLTKGHKDNWETPPAKGGLSIFAQLKTYRSPYLYDFNETDLLNMNEERLKKIQRVNEAEYELTKQVVQVKEVLLSDGKRYSGWGYTSDKGFIPHGVGKKFYSDVEAWGNFVDGDLNGPAMRNHHNYMTVGIFKNNRLNGWGISFNQGILTQFGYFENSQFKTDLTDIVEWFYEDVLKLWDDKESGMATTFTDKQTHMMHEFLVGWSYREYCPEYIRHQMGYHFMLDGTVWVGATDKINMTGTLMKFQNDGHIIIGKFNNGEFVEPLSFKQWFNKYMPGTPQVTFEIDSNKNYFL